MEELLVGEQRMFIQFGAFQQEAGALSLLKRLQENGISFAHIQQSRDGYYRVRSGPFSSSSSAREMVLRGRGVGLDGNLVPESAL